MYEAIKKIGINQSAFDWLAHSSRRQVEV